MRITLWILLTALCVVRSAGAETIWLGMSQEQVVRALGRPEAQATAGARTILVYPGGVRLELENNRLISTQGYRGEVALEPAPEVAPAPPPKPEPKAPPPPPPSASENPPPQSGLFVRNDNLPAYSNTGAPSPTVLLQTARYFERLHQARVFDSEGKLEPWEWLLLACLMRLVLTMCTLQWISQKVERTLPWLGALWLAALDTGVRVGLDAAGYGLWRLHLPLLLREACAAGVLIVLVTYHPDVRQLSPAMKIVIGTKIVVFLLTLVLFLVMLNVSA
ncbi:MAG: hypothetical protein HZA31_05410 [Opitutae bacterium]|nr:hypothetical protein [Opitutae bacterium]